MNEQLDDLVKFVNADKRRFLQVQYIEALYPELNGEQWEVGVFLGPGWTCAEPFEVGMNHWLQVKRSTYPEALQAAVERLETVREVKG